MTGETFASIRSYVLALLLLGTPIALSINPAGTLLGELILFGIFFFPGYLIGTQLNRTSDRSSALTNFVLGVVTVTTVYDVSSLARIDSYFPFFIGFLAISGVALFAWHLCYISPQWKDYQVDRETFTAGSIVALCLAPIYWRSGRFWGNEFVFYGPAGQDHLYHLTLLQRLSFHVPPDNFIASGLRAPVYHYFDDLILSVVLRVQNSLHLVTANPFDLYYRCYPAFLYFCIGALAYNVGRQLLSSAKGGALAVLLLLGAGGFPWVFGVMQSVIHVSNFRLMRSALFSDWTSWDGVGSVLPLVHRPAHYHGLLICLTAVNVLLDPKRLRSHWILAGLLFGMLAGFNFTLAATFGLAAVLASLILLASRQGSQARDLGILALSAFVGSLPVNAAMFLSGFHQTAPGIPFRGPNMHYPTEVWGYLLSRMIPAQIVPLACFAMLVVIAYGVKLVGIGALARLDLGGNDNRGTATVLMIVAVLSFLTGMFFTYQGIGGGNIIFLQPTLWILALFSLRPLGSWLERNHARWPTMVLWGMMGLTWVQSLAAFHFSYKVAFDDDSARVFQEIRSSAAADDVIAYLPSDWTTTAIWGRSITFPNYVFTGMTGLDGYISNELYTKFYAAPGLSGRSATEVFDQAERLYEQRRSDLEAFLRGLPEDAASARLASNHVRWIVISGDTMLKVSTPAVPWRKTSQLEVWRLPRQGE